MLFSDDERFARVRAVRLGEAEMPPLLGRLGRWIGEKFGVGVVYVGYGRVGEGVRAGRPRLEVVLDRDAEHASWMDHMARPRPDVERAILARFAELRREEPEAFEVRGLWLDVESFEEACLIRAYWAFLGNDAERIVREFEDVPIWTIDGRFRDLTVFLMTDADVRRHEASGTCARIAGRCFEEVKKYDDFGYLSEASFELEFSSKENLDANYEGNLFCYSRR